MTTTHPSAGTHDAPGVLDLRIDLAVSTERFTAAMSDIGETMRKVAQLLDRVRAAFNRPDVVAGIEGRFYVRAGLDPAYVDDLSLDCLIRIILAGTTGDPEVDILTAANRRRVAVAAMRGWAVHRHDPAVRQTHAPATFVRDPFRLIAYREWTTS